MTETSTGQQRPVIKDLSGNPIHDQRIAGGPQPAFAPALPDSLAEARSYAEFLDVSDITVSGRTYVVLQRYKADSLRFVALAVDKDTFELVIIKRTRRGIFSDLGGFDSFDRLYNEYDVLDTINKNGLVGIPTAVAFDSTEGIATLVTSACLGTALNRLSMSDQILAIPLLVEKLQELHDHGIIHRDIKLENFLFDGSEIAIIDFELSCPFGTVGPIRGGSMGHVPPEGTSSKATSAYDMYGIGVTIFRVLSRIDPSRVPSSNQRGRMIGILQALGYTAAVPLIATLLAYAPDERPTAAQLRCVLADTGDIARRSSGQPRKPPRRSGGRAAAKMTCDLAQYQRDLETKTWWRTFYPTVPEYGESLAYGTAGIAFALRTIATISGREDDRIHRAANWLAARAPSGVAHGLFTGNAGVALVLAVEGRRRSESRFIEAARLRLRQATCNDSDDWDFFSGVAGIAWSALTVARLIEADWPLDIASNSVRRLQATARYSDRTIVWPSSSTNLSNMDRSFYGCAHGSAGIGTTLVAWGKATNDQSTFRLGRDVLSSICENALAADNFSLRMGPDMQPTSTGMWCHGTLGLLWSLGQATLAYPELSVLSENLLNAAPDPIQIPGNASFCHGIAGYIDTLRLPAFRNRVEILRLDVATSMLRVLALRDHGHFRWLPDIGNQFSPELMTGFLGPAAQLAMIAGNEQDSMLSADWIVKCSRSRHLDPCHASK